MEKTAIEKAQEALRARREAGIVAERLTPMQRAAKSPKSLRLAVTAKCWDCQGGNHDPGIRERIQSCSVVKCPLNPVRPYQR